MMPIQPKMTLNFSPSSHLLSEVLDYRCVPPSPVYAGLETGLKLILGTK